MKISMVSTLPPIKGISDYTISLIKSLPKGIEVDFYGFKNIYPEFLYPGGTKTNEKEPKFDNVEIHNYLKWYNPLSWLKVGNSFKTDIVHVQWWSWALAPMYYIMLKKAKNRGKKIIMTIHNVKPHEKSFIKNKMNKSVINLADEYVVHSENNKKMFLEETKTKKPIHVIPHGIIEIEKSGLTKKELKDKYDFSDKDKILLFFGAIREYKGLDTLLLALKEIKDESVKLIIAGKPWGDFKKYQEIIDKNDLKNRVRLFLDFIPKKQVAEFFEVCDLVILPYKEFEASSGVATLAINFNKQLLVSNVGSLPELVDGSNLIFHPNQTNGLKNLIENYFLSFSKNKIKLAKPSKKTKLQIKKYGKLYENE